MTVIDIIFRVDAICKKYDKYNVEKQRQRNSSGSSDAFTDLYDTLESDLDKALRKAEMASMETNRATKVAMNAEVRRTKAKLAEEIPKLQKLARKKVKGLSQEDLQTRNDLVILLIEKIQEIPDGATATPKTGAWGTSASNNHIKFDDLDGNFNSDFFEQSVESEQFRNEYEMRRKKQDEGLDVISEGLDTLKNIALEMSEEMDRQVPLMNEIDEKVDKVTSDTRKNNVRLKEEINRVRSSRNVCIDLVLICVLLGIGSYLYQILQ